jgi:ArsR family transcriptional regulator, arsenate/arsenite/antimonite-responsive transcriptional repressor
MKELLNITKALADGNRLRVVAALMEHEELCVCQMTEMLRLATATVSRHMSVLQNAELVQSRKDGRWVYYRLTRSFPKGLRQYLISSLQNSNEIKTDRKTIGSILSCKRDDLCKRQKKR